MNIMINVNYAIKFVLECMSSRIYNYAPPPPNPPEKVSKLHHMSDVIFGHPLTNQPNN